MSDDIFSCLDTIHEHDGRTDTGRQLEPHLRIASCGKMIINETSHMKKIKLTLTGDLEGALGSAANGSNFSTKQVQQ